MTLMKKDSRRDTRTEKIDYEREFQIYSTNVNFAARSLHYHLNVQNHAKQPHILEALNKHPRFWLDYNYLCIQSVFIVLGRVFDTDKRSHSIDRLLEAVTSTDHFKNETLRQRKIKGSDNHKDWIDNYIKNAHELNAEDHKTIYEFIDETKKIWNAIKDIRNKLFAHEDVLDETSKLAILQKGEYNRLVDLVQRLLTFEHVLEQASLNGTKPDFSFQSPRSMNLEAETIASLLSCLSD